MSQMEAVAEDEVFASRQRSVVEMPLAVSLELSTMS